MHGGVPFRRRKISCSITKEPYQPQRCSPSERLASSLCGRIQCGPSPLESYATIKIECAKGVKIRKRLKHIFICIAVNEMRKLKQFPLTRHEASRIIHFTFK